MTETVFHTFEDLPADVHVLTIGSFDGVHRGHQYLLDQVIRQARNHNARSLVITFDPLPAEVLRPDRAPTRLCSIEERVRQIRNRGIDRVVVLPFNDELSRQTADQFLNDVVASARPSALVIGEDFAFGYRRQGTPEFLNSRAGSHGFELEIVSRVNPDGIELSSSSVRRALADEGNVTLAREVLGRYFRLSGVVRDGDRRGRTLGYPTANLAIPEFMTLPSDGIYAGLVGNPGRGNEPDQPALVYVGTRPTFWQTERIVEVFLLDFAGDLYGTELAVDFIERIRGDQRFASPDELVEQMARDEAAGREIFSSLGILDPVTDR